MKRLNGLELILGIVAIGGAAGAVVLGYLDTFHISYSTGISSSIKTGYDGGAIAMGIISAVSIFGIVLIELAKFNKN